MTLPLFEEPMDPGPAGTGPRTVSLVRLAGEIARALGPIGRVAVEGEVYRPTTSRGGFVFFTLKDRAAQMDVRVPAQVARRSRIVAGERVCVVAKPQWTPDRGSLQLVAEGVSPVGAGAIAAMIADLRARLVAEGFMDRPRRRLPVLPAVVGVLCGAEAAVRRDIESVVADRCPGYPVLFHETTVSGPAATLTIVEGIEILGHTPGVEVVILARGGGDAPSLLPWSTEEVCRAVAACPVPVVSAIGHDGDRPLCDEVADLRCGTPSLAATAVLPDLEGLRAALDDRLGRSAAGVRARMAAAGHRAERVDVSASVLSGLDRASGRLQRSAIRITTCHPGRRLGESAARLGRADHRRGVWEAVGRAGGRLESEMRHLRALSPERTLERGYAVVSGPDGRVLRRADEVSPGMTVRARLAHGSIEATVTEVVDLASAPVGDRSEEVES